MYTDVHAGDQRPSGWGDTLWSLALLLFSLAVALWLVSLIGAVRAEAPLVFAVRWVPSLGVDFAFLVDGLSLLFALLVSGVGFFVSLYATFYLRSHPLLKRFFLYLLLFMIGMLGLVLAGNLITLFVFWEVTTVASYLLIGFNHESATARRSALQALLITALGGLALLAGLILLGSAAGTYDLAEVLSARDLVQGHALYVPILVLVLIGAFTKSAQMPLHFWLPNAMAAPTPVSAYLHSATMVKAGIYLLARLHPVLGGTGPWMWILTVVGAVTAIVAAILALRQTDLKLALAYTTVVALGTLTMFLGSDASVAIAAAITFVLVHSLYKAALFMVVGMIDHQTGTRELHALGGLFRRMPVTFGIALAAGLSMAGFPPFLGFIGKELKYEGALAITEGPMLVAFAAVFANALIVAVSATVVLRPFCGRLPPNLSTTREASPGLWVPALVLALLGFAFGVAPALVADSLVQPAVTAILGRPEVVKLKLWHGVNLPLMMSVATLLLGLAVYLLQDRLRARLHRLARRLPARMDVQWDRGLAGFKHAAAAQTRWLQHGVLKHYMAVVFTTVALGLGWALLHTGGFDTSFNWERLTLKEWAAMALVLTGALVAMGSRAPLTAICSLGGMGVGVALIYLFFGAPDVAITQLLVETLFLVLVAMTLHRLPHSMAVRGTRPRYRDALIALLVGTSVSFVLLAVIQQPLVSPTKEYFELAAVPEAFGRNIVNVILVDFRALDTFGEVVVVLVAAVGAAALLRHTRKKGHDERSQQGEAPP
ncbi:hydrogen gas-evolving membrane-bound hydrogenase subunit E [Microbulbifer sp. Q7]|uniref:hydrogen gas-evolving membrane-bound hydrogenase subunit E n=1 Tax=Microbulbifer sp. Q7 TaxID=1785091 RepID=UPI00082B2217|nr:hydrogen gas-evolving membrane-bound hydrogenase subunit E [Microbulbifer sp. Q7]